MRSPLPSRGRPDQSSRPWAGFGPLVLAVSMIILSSTASCAPGEAPATIPTPLVTTPPPSPTRLLPQVTSSPYQAITPSLVFEAQRTTPLPSPTTPAVVLPPEELVVLKPGDGSHVTSPFQVNGYVQGDGYRHVQIRLLGESGAVLQERDSRLRAIGDHPHFFIAELEFEIPTLAETARLEVSLRDPAGGMIDHLTTARLILLSIGPGDIRPVIEGPERVTILTPAPGANISGGQMEVYGTAWLESRIPLSIQLLSKDGMLISSAEATLQARALGELGEFRADLGYQVSAASPAQLLVCEISSPVISPVHCASLELSLAP